MGRNEKLENNPVHVFPLSKRCQVEIDLWRVNDMLFLGHDAPTYKIKQKLFNKNLWIHCKNLSAVEFMSKTKYNWFWHENDKMTLTSKGYIWCFPEVYMKDGITVMNCASVPPAKLKGICTDFLNYYE